MQSCGSHRSSLARSGAGVPTVAASDAPENLDVVVSINRGLPKINRMVLYSSLWGTQKRYPKVWETPRFVLGITMVPPKRRGTRPSKRAPQFRGLKEWDEGRWGKGNEPQCSRIYNRDPLAREVTLTESGELTQ